MRNEQVSESQFLLQVFQQVDDLGLYRHIQGGDGFVADNQLRAQDQGSRNADPLTLTA